MNESEQAAGGASAPSPEETLHALAVSRRRADAFQRAHRAGLLRRAGEGHVAGVCAALARGNGLPVRLVRLAAVGLLPFGIGVPLYLLGMLLLPREAAPRPDGRREIDIPWRSLIGGGPRRGDVLVVAGLVVSAVLCLLWLDLVLARMLPLLWVIVPYVTVLLAVLGVGAIRARRARADYLLAELSRRAGILDEREFETALRTLRQDAPRAWAGQEPAGTPLGPAPRERKARPGRPRAAAFGGRRTMLSLALLLAAGTVVFGLVTLVPALAPAFVGVAPLDGVARVGTAAAVVTVLAGVLLVHLGWHRRRSPVLGSIGVLAFTVFAISVVWVRLTDSTGSEPILVEVDRYQPGASIVCPGDGVREWNRPVVIDLSQMQAPPDGDALDQQWYSQWGVSESQEPTPDVSMYLECSRRVGDVQVILPPPDIGVAVEGRLTSTLGTSEGPVPVLQGVWDARSPVVHMDGSLGVGSITYVATPASGDEDQPTDADGEQG
ncbi:MAG: PspC domain-containing protein [Brachybacterium sp.]|nr:PspC domain-containing protein [Brachybacterium sp.]